MNLLEIFRAYPGGVSKLAADSGLNLFKVYKVASGAHIKAPVQALDALARAVGSRKLLGRRYSGEDLLTAWQDAHASVPPRPVKHSGERYRHVR